MGRKEIKKSSSESSDFFGMHFCAVRDRTLHRELSQINFIRRVLFFSFHQVFLTLISVSGTVPHVRNLSAKSGKISIVFVFCATQKLTVECDRLYRTKRRKQLVIAALRRSNCLLFVLGASQEALLFFGNGNLNEPSAIPSLHSSNDMNAGFLLLFIVEGSASGYLSNTSMYS